MAFIVEDLSEVKAAAEIQVSAISALVKELQAGMDRLVSTLNPKPYQAGMDRLVSELSLCNKGLGPLHEDAFEFVVSQFVQANHAECLSLTSCEQECIAELQELSTYFEEKFDHLQPNKVLVTLRDFLASLSKAFRENKARKIRRGAKNKI